MTKFEIQTATGYSAKARRHVPIHTESRPVAHTLQPTTPWWANILAGLADLFSRFGTPTRGAAPTLEQVGWTRMESVEDPRAATLAPRAIGATPTHYRAFSLLQPRIKPDRRMPGAQKAIVSFREHAKEIRQLKTRQVNDAACAVLDTFVQLVDAFIPLWDAAGKAEDLLVSEIGEGARVELHAEMLETVARLDAELARVLSGESLSREHFDTVQRYVEIRYGEDAKEGYGLSPV